MGQRKPTSIRKPSSSRSFPGSGPCKFDPALLKSLSSGSEVDSPRSQFWIKYDEIASDFDQRLVSRLENCVNISMIFAGLFSAVNTAFIVAIQSNIVALNTSDATIWSIVNTGGLVPLLTWTSALSYASLCTSLLSSFGALLAKQWLAHFNATRSTHGSLSSRGVHRQCKFDAMQNSHFNTILDFIPVLLQISLLLFAISLLGDTWYPYRDVTSVILAATVIGFTLYFVTFFAAMLSPNSPFQTLPSQLTRLFLHSLSRWLRSDLPWLVRGLFSYYRTSNSKPNTISLSIATRSEEAPAVRWLLQVSSDPAVVTAVAKMVPEVDWPVDFDLDAFVEPLLETFKSSFRVQSNGHNAVSLFCTNLDQAYACSKALVHLYSEILYGECGPDEGLMEDLESVKCCLVSAENLRQDTRFNFIRGLISLVQSDGDFETVIPVEELSWISHLLPAFFHSTKYYYLKPWIRLAVLAIPKYAPFETTPSKVLANYWITIGFIVSMRINPEDLVKVDKSSAIDRIRSLICGSVGPNVRIPSSTPDIADKHRLACYLIHKVLAVEHGREMITKRVLDGWIASRWIYAPAEKPSTSTSVIKSGVSYV